MRPARTPIGLVLSRAARVVSRAFDEALADAGGSLPMWLVVLNLKSGRAANQRELAASVGVAQKFCDEIRRLLTACGSDPLQSLGILAFDCEQDAHLPFRISAMPLDVARIDGR